MRIFVTGATGFIGTALLPELLAAGHEVIGLARSDRTVQALSEMGAAAHRGDLDDPASLAAGASTTDGTIHLAFDHGRMADDVGAVVAADRKAIEAMVGALEGTGRPFVGTSGVMVLTPGVERTEADAGDPASAAGFRVLSEEAVLAGAGSGVRASVVRLSPVVHGEDDRHGFVPMLVGAARALRRFSYVGDGFNRWPAVHRSDAARLFRLALERGEAGTRYHGVAEDGVAVRDIAEALGRRLGMPASSIRPDEAGEGFGPLAAFAAADIRTSSAATHRLLGWEPTGPTLLEDVAAGVYG